MLNFKILVFYLYYDNKPYRTPQHFLKFWSKTWGGGGINDMLSPPSSGDVRHCHIVINPLALAFKQQSAYLTSGRSSNTLHYMLQKEGGRVLNYKKGSK